MIRLIALGALFGQIALSQVIQGSIRNTSGQGIADATVTSATVSARTDATGAYRLHPLSEGTYSLHVQATGYAPTTFGPFALTATGSKKIDFTLKPVEAEFFDQPSFIVAGVADPTDHGGHGSDALLRSTETLAKETASLGNVADRQDALEAVRAYQHAAELDRIEPNFFDWGSELLVHRATSQAIEVFTNAARLFPNSSRVLLGLAVAWYSNGADDNASHYFFAACDLHPNDPVPYQFLGKVQSAGITASDGYVERLERFVKLDPENPLANYYYAAGLWKQRKPDDLESVTKVRALLEKAIRLDQHCAPAYLQLGILYSTQRDSANSILAFQKAGTQEAHYRLAQEYKKLGENKKAEEELTIFTDMSRKSADQARQERLEIQQFVFKLREPK